MCLTTVDPQRTHSIDQKRLLSYNPKEFSVNDPVNDMRLGSFCGHAPKELTVIKTSFLMFLEEAFPRFRYWNHQLLALHAVVSVGVLFLMCRIFLTMLVSEHPWKALLGSVLIFLGVGYIAFPALKEVITIAFDYLNYRDSLALGLALARAHLMEPFIKEACKALGENKEPKIQLIKLIQLAAIANYPLEKLTLDFARYGMPEGVKRPKFVADRKLNPTCITCTFWAGRYSELSQTLVVYIDGSYQQ